MKKLYILFAFLICFNQINAQTITTVAGTGTGGYSGDGGSATNAKLYAPWGIATDASGNLYIADDDNYRIRKVNSNGIITTVAGNGTQGFSGDGGLATNAKLTGTFGITLDKIGNIYIVDEGNSRVRKVNTNGIITTFAGNGNGGNSGDGGLAINATLSEPWGVTVDGLGNVFVSNNYSNVVRKINTNGIISTIAGIVSYGPSGYSGDGGNATNAKLYGPAGLAADASGNLYIADSYNNRIRKVNSNGIISTFAGTGFRGSTGDGGPATSAEFFYPQGITLDSSGNLYIADFSNSRIRIVNTLGIISTFAGTGGNGTTGDGGLAINAEVGNCISVAIDPSGNVYICEHGNQVIRKVLASNSIDTDIKQITDKNVQINIYPNPSNNSVSVKSVSVLGAITICNSLGETVLQTKSKNNQEQIDISKFTSGVYTIQVQNTFLKLIKE
jgi:hypothetical protein